MKPKKINLREIINNSAKLIINKFRDKGLVSLYLAGTILTKDRVFNSDIEVFGFVRKEFNIKKEEDEINKFFDKNKSTLNKGIECRFRAIGIDELSGRVKRGNLTKYIGIREWAITFPFWKHLYGKRSPWVGRVEPYGLSSRKKLAIKKLRFMIEDIRKNRSYFIQNISKQVIRLAGIESEKIQNKKFIYSYIDIEERFSKDKDHIVHEAMKLRRKTVSKKEINDFIKKVEDYIKYMERLK